MSFSQIMKSLWRLTTYRGRLCDGIKHDIRQRYIGSVFGSLWAILYPLLQLTIYAILYTYIFKIRPTGLTEMGYVLLVFSGLIPLMAFSEAINSSTTSLSSNKNLLLNTVFPAELIPLRAAISAQITSIIGLFITLLLGYALGRTSWHAILFVPFIWLLLLMFCIGIGWILSLISLIARDIQHGLGLITMVCFILSPFAYTPEMVPNQLKLLIYINPLSYFVLMFQSVICYGSWPNPILSLCTCMLAFTSFLIGFTIFQKAKHIFFDYA